MAALRNTIRKYITFKTTMQKFNQVRHRWVRVFGMAGLAAVLFAPLGPTAVKADTKTTSTSTNTASSGQQKFTICHKGTTTIVISQASYDSHLAHGDTPGPCNVTTVN